MAETHIDPEAAVRDHKLYPLSVAIKEETNEARLRQISGGDADENEGDFIDFLQEARSRVDGKIGKDTGIQKGPIEKIRSEIKDSRARQQYEESWKSLMDDAQTSAMNKDELVSRLDRLYSLWKKSPKMDFIPV